MSRATGLSARADGSQRLVVRSLPEVGESLYGWAVRLAEANGYSSAAEILALVGPFASETLPNPVAERLACLVGASRDDFEPYIAGKVGLFRRGGELRFARHFYDEHLKICPACLGEHPVLRSVWNLKVWKFCPRHLCKLIEVCPFCHRSISLAQRAVCHCGNRYCTGDLRNADVEPAPPKARNILGMLNNSAFGETIQWFPELPNAFRKVLLGDVVRLIHLFGKAVQSGRNNAASAIAVSESLEVTEGALTCWPRGYHEYLSRIRMLRGRTIERESVLYREFPVIFHGLRYAQVGLVDYGVLVALREELANYVEQNVPSALNARYWITGQKSQWVTRRGSINEMGVSEYAMRRAQRQSAIHATTAPVGKRRCKHFFAREDVLVHMEDGGILTTQRAFKERYELISFLEVASLLRIGRPLVEQLAKAGYFQTRTHWGATWCVAASVKRLLVDLSNVSNSTSRSGGPWIDIRRFSSICSGKLSDVIQSALQGRLRLLEQNGRGCGLERFVASRKDLVELFPQISSAYLRVQDAAGYLGWSQPYIVAAMRGGLLRSVKGPRRGRLIERKELDRFGARYTNSVELGMIYGLTRWQVLVALASISACHLGEGSTRLFRRRSALSVLDSKFVLLTSAG